MPAIRRSNSQPLIESDGRHWVAAGTRFREYTSAMVWCCQTFDVLLTILHRPFIIHDVERYSLTGTPSFLSATKPLVAASCADEAPCRDYVEALGGTNAGTTNERFPPG